MEGLRPRPDPRSPRRIVSGELPRPLLPAQRSCRLQGVRRPKRHLLGMDRPCLRDRCTRGDRHLGPASRPSNCVLPERWSLHIALPSLPRVAGCRDNWRACSRRCDIGWGGVFDGESRVTFLAGRSTCAQPPTNVCLAITTCHAPIIQRHLQSHHPDPEPTPTPSS